MTTTIDSMIGKLYHVRAGTCPLTGQPQVLAGLQVQVVGPGGMAAALAVRLVGKANDVAHTLAQRDPWWTLERVEQLLLAGCLEFDSAELA
jgi:hypothetical protein